MTKAMKRHGRAMKKYKFTDLINSRFFKYSLSLMAGAILAYLGISFIRIISPACGKIFEMVVEVLKPLVLGLVISYLLSPIINLLDDKLKRNGRSHRGLAIVICLLSILLVITLVIWVIISLLTKEIRNITYDDVTALLGNFNMSLEDFLDRVLAELSELGMDQAKISSFAGGMVSGITGAASTILFGLIFAIYFMYDGNNISAYWIRIGKRVLPPDKVELIKDVMADADKCFSGYIRGQTIDAFLVGVIASIALTVAGMPYSIVIGSIIGFGNLIPYVGPIIGYGIIIAVNLLHWDPKMLVTGLIIVAVLMFVDGNVINPRLLAGTVQVHPLLVVASLIAGGAIGGLLGMLLAVPVGALIKMRFEKSVFGLPDHEKSDKK